MIAIRSSSGAPTPQQFRVKTRRGPPIGIRWAGSSTPGRAGGQPDFVRGCENVRKLSTRGTWVCRIARSLRPMTLRIRSAGHRLVAISFVIAAVLVIFVGVARAGDEFADQDYDPWAGFNERMFSFNQAVLDRFVVKPAATAWDKVCPDVAKRGVGRAIDNLKMPRRLVNDLLQGRVVDAGSEVGRFLVNTTAGVGGFVDVATKIHLPPTEADMGETLGVWGVGAGPYLVLPFL